MINLHESMGPGRDRTRDPWICSQTQYLFNITGNNTNTYTFDMVPYMNLLFKEIKRRKKLSVKVALNKQPHLLV